MFRSMDIEPFELMRHERRGSLALGESPRRVMVKTRGADD